LRHFGPSIGLIGRIVAILLLAILLEFGANTMLYERASHFSVRDDEAHRLAEHLFIARRLVAEQPLNRRPAMAASLSTDHYAMAWERDHSPPPALAPTLDRMREQVLEWEPGLAASDLRLRLLSFGHSSVVVGGVRLADGSWLQFQTLEPIGRLDAPWNRIFVALVLALGVMVLSGVLIRRTLTPMRTLADAADRFGSVEQEPVVEEGPGEVRRVIGAFNRMQERIHRLIADRTEALAAVGHDLRTPLARLRLRSDRIENGELRDTVQGDVAEMEAMVASLLAFLGGEGDPEVPVPVDLAVLCATLVDDASDRGHHAEYAGPDHLDWKVRPSGFKRALVNLVENALHYGDTVTILLEETAQGACLAVEDDGPGIPEEALARVLEPFVRLDSARARDTVGFGLGLPIVLRAVEAEGGTLTLSNRTEGGLRAEISLPRPAAVTEASAAR
jgi:signal transduction histidine kinase